MEENFTYGHLYCCIKRMDALKQDDAVQIARLILVHSVSHRCGLASINVCARLRYLISEDGREAPLYN